VGKSNGKTAGPSLFKEQNKRDSAGRVLLPAVLRQHGELVQDVIFVGVSDHVEMWDRDKWNEYRSVVLEELTDIAEGVEGF